MVCHALFRSDNSKLEWKGEIGRVIIAEPKGEASNRGARVAMSLYTVQVAIYMSNLK